MPPLTTAQEGIWYAQLLDPGNPIYNCAEYVAIEGALDVGRFTAAFHWTIAAADALHVTFEAGSDGPRQHLNAPAALPPPVIDLTSEPDPGAAALDHMRADLAKPRAMTEPGLAGAALFRTGPASHLFYLRLHHLLGDAFAFSMIFRGVARHYSGEPAAHFAPLTELLAEEAAYRGSPGFAEDREFWLARFADRPEVTGLTGLEQPRTGHRFDRVEGTTTPPGAGWPEMTIAAMAAHTHKMTGATDIVLGLPSMGRLGSAATRVPATVVNILPFRLTVCPDQNMAALAGQVRAELIEIRAHQRYRHEDLARDLGLVGTGRRLFGPQVNLKPFGRSLRFGPLTGTVHYLAAGPVEDFELIAYCHDGGLHADISANPGLYTVADLAAHHRRIVGLLDAAATRPDRPIGALPVATGDERKRLAEWNATAHDVPPGTLHGLFEARARQCPRATAVIAEEGGLTYEELDAAANDLARQLTEHGAAPGERVAVSVPRSPDLVISLLAVLKTGAAYVPVDPDYPPDRIAYMLDDARPVCVITPDGLPPGGSGGPISKAYSGGLTDPGPAAACAGRPPMSSTRRDRPGAPRASWCPTRRS